MGRKLVLLLGARIPLETPGWCCLPIVLSLTLVFVLLPGWLAHPDGHPLLVAVPLHWLLLLLRVVQVVGTLTAIAFTCRLAIICYPKEFDPYNNAD